MFANWHSDLGIMYSHNQKEVSDPDHRKKLWFGPKMFYSLVFQNFFSLAELFPSVKISILCTISELATSNFSPRNGKNWEKEIKNGKTLKKKTVHIISNKGLFMYGSIASQFLFKIKKNFPTKSRRGSRFVSLFAYIEILLPQW